MENTLEWEMLTTLMKRVQKNEELEREEKNKRFNMLLLWWKKNGKKFEQISKKVRINAKKNERNLFDKLVQLRYIHTLHLAYKGIERQNIDISDLSTENAEKSIDDDETFIKSLIEEIKENHRRLQKYFQEFN